MIVVKENMPGDWSFWLTCHPQATPWKRQYQAKHQDIFQAESMDPPIISRIVRQPDQRIGL